MSNTDISTRFSRLFVQVHDENRFKRKQALENIKNEVIEQSDSIENDLFICDKIVTVLFDEGERNREIVCNLLEKIIKRQKDNLEPLLPKIIPELVRKLGDKDNIDPCEEIRTNLLNILLYIIHHAKKAMSLFIEDSILICFHTLTDNYSEIKRITCYIIDEMSKLSDYNFYNNCEVLIKPLIGNLCHQHSKVRVDTINCLGNVLLGGNIKSFDTVCSSLAQRLFDDNSNVRKSIIEVFGRWLLDLTDRYSYHAKLIPVFLTGYIDENDDIKELTEDLWHDIGMKFQQENEQDLKEQIDFEETVLKHYPENFTRPNLGCRTLMFRNISKILPPLTRDLGDWTEGTRIKAAQLLPYLIINGELCCTQHCQLLIGSTLIRGLVDDQLLVRNACQQASLLLGYFIKPQIWWKILRALLDRCDADVKFVTGQLTLLKCILESSLSIDLIEINNSNDNSISIIQDICQFLQKDNIVTSLSVNIKLAGLNCLNVIVTKIGGDYKHLYETEMGYHIFYSTIAFCSYYEDGGISTIDSSQTHQICQQFDNQLNSIINKLTNHLQINPYQQYTSRLLIETLLINKGELIYSNEVCREMACLLLVKSNNVLIEIWDNLIGCLAKVLATNQNKGSTNNTNINSIDLQTKTRLFVVLLRLFADEENQLINHLTSDLLESLLINVLIPNLQWQAGRTAEALRRLVTMCVWSLLVNWFKKNIENNFELSYDLYTQLQTRLMTILDDDLLDTRQSGARALVVALDMMNKQGVVYKHAELNQQIHNIYPNIIKRLDDTNDDIRILATKVLLSWLKCLENDFKESKDLYRCHIEELCSGILIHLDDYNPKVQESVYQVLSKVGEYNKEICHQEIMKVIDKHRSTYWCDKLISELS